MEIICNIINVFTVIFDQFNVFSEKKMQEKILLTLNFLTVVYNFILIFNIVN